MGSREGQTPAGSEGTPHLWQLQPDYIGEVRQNMVNVQ